MPRDDWAKARARDKARNGDRSPTILRAKRQRRRWRNKSKRRAK